MALQTARWSGLASQAILRGLVIAVTWRAPRGATALAMLLRDCLSLAASLWAGWLVCRFRYSARDVLRLRALGFALPRLPTI